VSEGRRSEFAAFGWKPDEVPDPQNPETFQRSKLKWDEVGSGLHAEVLDWYKKLIALRKQTPDLTDGHLEDVDSCYSEPDCWFVLNRGPIQVACNLSKVKRQIPVDSDADQLLASHPDCSLGNGLIQMPPESVSILCIRDQR
jgi:maltooligosyltrehalose trehalohydrolase